MPDSRTTKLIIALEAFLDDPPPGLPDQLFNSIADVHEDVIAPRYSQETPGEKEADKVASQSEYDEDEYEEIDDEDEDVVFATPGEQEAYETATDSEG